MLYISRKIGQGIRIGNNITISILEVKGKTIRIGIDSPPEISILREELYQSVIQENLSASTAFSNDSDINIILNLETKNVNGKE